MLCFLFVFVVFLVESSSTRGFNATYVVNTCPEACGVHRRCVLDKCVCEQGWGGIDCQTQLCPKNCSYNMGQGTCDQVCVPSCVFLSLERPVFCLPTWSASFVFSCLYRITDSVRAQQATLERTVPKLSHHE